MEFFVTFHSSYIQPHLIFYILTIDISFSL